VRGASKPIRIGTSCAQVIELKAKTAVKAAEAMRKERRGKFEESTINSKTSIAAASSGPRCDAPGWRVAIGNSCQRIFKKKNVSADFPDNLEEVYSALSDNDNIILARQRPMFQQVLVSRHIRRSVAPTGKHGGAQPEGVGIDAPRSTIRMLFA
jgi:hypothetical protein